MQRYQSDRAVRKPADDLLGRVSFAQHLADACLGWREDESLVMALSGAWGSGKTSIKNFFMDALQPEGSIERADVLEFSPWELSGSGDVEAHFFNRIGAYLGRRDSAGIDRQIARKWNKWAAALKIPHGLAEPLTNYLSSSAVSLGLATMAVSATTINKLPWLIGGALVATGGNLLAVSTTVAERVAQFFNAKADALDGSAGALKKELADLLRNRERPLVIVIDDIDRLASNEMRLVFRLIKANADLPRILYFLLFDREAVVQTLELDGVASGERYLEKIVQAPFTVPVIQAALLNDVLVSRLNEILNALPDSAEFDQQRWIDLFFQHLRVYFITLRDVYRFLAAFEFDASAFAHGASYEVNVVDLFALETLRLFEPLIYGRLAGRKQLLVRGSLSTWDTNTDVAKKELQDLVVGAKEPEAVRATLRSLFPRASWAWGGSGYAEGFDVPWTEAKRAGTDIHFDKYFHFAVPQGDISQNELDALIEISGDREVLRRRFCEFRTDGRIVRLFFRLEYDKERVPESNAVPFVTALLDETDDLPQNKSMFGTDADMHVVRIIYWYLVRLVSVAQREAVLRAAITATGGLYAPAHVVALEEPTDRTKPDRERIIGEKSLPEFQRLCVEKIQAAARHGGLLDHPHMLSLLYWWRSWAGEAPTRLWAADVIKQPASAARFLARFIQIVKSQGMGSLVTRQTPRINLKSLEAFVSLDALDNALRVEPDESADVEQAVALFRKALARRRRGLPDLEPGSLSDDEEDSAS